MIWSGGKVVPGVTSEEGAWSCCAPQSEIKRPTQKLSDALGAVGDWMNEQYSLTRSLL
jgi:hypothetical protein